MKNSTTATAKQIRLRINQLNNLISKFPRVRSLVRKWAFELTVLEGRLESLKAVAVVEPKQLTIWDIQMSNEDKGTKENPIKVYYSESDGMLSLFPRKDSKIADWLKFGIEDWIDEEGVEHDSRDEAIVAPNSWVLLSDGVHFIDEIIDEDGSFGVLMDVGWEIRNGEPVKIKR